MSGTYILKATTALAIALVAALTLIAFQGDTDPIHANHAVEFGVDVIDSGNSTTAVGTIDTCRVVSNGTTFNIDIFIKNTDNLIAAEAYFQYDPSLLTILSRSSMTGSDVSKGGTFQSTQTGSSVLYTGDTLPDGDGIFKVGGVETAQVNGDTGQGVVIRLSVRASLTKTGISYAKISKIDANGDGVADFGVILRDYQGNLIDTADEDPFFDGKTYNSGVIVGSGSSCTGDSDGDGVIDALDNCPTVPNPNQENWNGNSLGDHCEDSDGDGILDINDNCKGVANADQADMDGDGLGDLCDPDRDGDGVLNTSDNCINVSNANQSDIDGDGIGDVCDSDIDGDGFLNTQASSQKGAESYLTTNMYLACPATTTAFDEAADAWPYDFDDNRTINTTDVLQLKPVFLTSPTSANWNPRMDINQSGSVNTTDVLQLKPVFLTSCTP